MLQLDTNQHYPLIEKSRFKRLTHSVIEGCRIIREEVVLQVRQLPSFCKEKHMRTSINGSVKTMWAKGRIYIAYTIRHLV